ncbi:hypothetical protein DM860_007561 [Cuscuta australis]|uniref:CBF1-interacting co-repressor CIR N-terminal domain-containing protein n=1 Tax=Cuscuta australis TaxID=267555 RepID=A0A328E8G7_9ASTE|nr:hypothetical protein DM860_007561 [Cuscuta australis]
MALKFLNKKGWHTGSLRNIENVWKAEQKHEAEQKKLEELRKQIVEERERAEFRELQEQAGLVPRQERLEFLYDSGLAVGKSSGFKALESLPTKTDPPDSTAASTSASKQAQSAVPGALFEDKPQSANDAWRKLHSDPLLLIRQREQEALARVKNNPVQMAMIRKSVEAMKHKTGDEKDEKHKRKHHHHHKRSKRHRKSNHHSSSGSDEDSSGEGKRKKDTHIGFTGSKPEREQESSHARDRKEYVDSLQRDATKREENRRRRPVRLSEEERAARLREMQLDAELHEEQRWKRIKKEEERDAKEAAMAGAQQLSSGGRNFLDAAQRSIYGAEKGGSSTIEESVRRRTHYSQRRSDEASERNAFRR